MARIDDLSSKYGVKSRLSKNLMNTMDPTSQKKYLDWLFKMRYVKGTKGYSINPNFPSNIKDKVKEHLVWRERNAQRIPKEYRDINTFKDIKTFLETMDKVATPSREDVKKAVRVIFEDEAWKVVVPLTFNASKLYGKNTKWCTTNKTYYEDYRKRGELYYIIDKSHNRKFGLSVTATGKINNLTNYTFSNNEDASIRYNIITSIYGKNIDWVKPIVADFNNTVTERMKLRYLNEFKNNITRVKANLGSLKIGDKEIKELMKSLVDES